MKIIFIIFIVLFSFQLSANDISEFEIEGFSIKTNLLNHYTKEEIQDNLRSNAYTHIKENNKFYHTEFHNDNFKDYDAIQISYKLRNNNFYELSMIAGAIFCENIIFCYEKQDQIIDDLSNIFKNFPKNKTSYKTSNGKITEVNYEILSGIIRVQVAEWKDDISWDDNIRVILMTDEFHNWLKK